MNRRNNAIDFPTNRDRDAFGEVIKRSSLSYAKGQFWRLEVVANPIETDCRGCQCGHANFRIVFNYGEYSGFGSDDYCSRCFYESVTRWLDNLKDEIKEQHREYRVENQ